MIGHCSKLTIRDQEKSWSLIFFERKGDKIFMDLYNGTNLSSINSIMLETYFLRIKYLQEIEIENLKKQKNIEYFYEKEDVTWPD